VGDFAGMGKTFSKRKKGKFSNRNRRKDLHLSEGDREDNKASPSRNGFFRERKLDIENDATDVNMENECEIISEEDAERKRKAYRTPSKIIDHVYVGTYHQSLDSAMLRKMGIQYLLCLKGSSRYPPRDFKYKHAPLSDYGRTDLQKFFQKVFPFIEKSQKEGSSILIYCSQGVNRAPTTAIGYLMFKKRWTLKRAYEYVRGKRSQSSPHEKYFQKLMEYEKLLYGNEDVYVLLDLHYSFKI